MLLVKTSLVATYKAYAYGMHHWCHLCPFSGQPHPVRIILQRPATDEAAQHHRLPAAVVNTYLHKEAAAVACAAGSISQTTHQRAAAVVTVNSVSVCRRAQYGIH
jgi:hypothetical protein